MLTALSEHPKLGFAYSRLTLNTVQLREEASTEHGNPDLLIWAEDEWFLCIEMKVSASEGTEQTRRYVDTKAFTGVGVRKANISSAGHHYVYLAPDGASEPAADEFVFVSWEWVTNQIEQFLVSNHERHPARSVTQLREFITTIRTELTMTEHQKNTVEKASLAIEYRDAIQEVDNALEEYIETLQNE